MKALKSYIEALHRDERGEIPVGPLLIIALVVIPLVVMLITFGDKLVDHFKDQWDTVSDRKVKSTTF